MIAAGIALMSLVASVVGVLLALDVLHAVSSGADK